MRKKSCPLNKEECPQSEQLPDILYKYCSNRNEKHLENLKENKWYFAHRDEFNDPSDFVVRWDTKIRETLENFLLHCSIVNHHKTFSRLSPHCASLSDYIQLALDEKIVTRKWVDEFFRNQGWKANPVDVIQKFIDLVGISCFSKIPNSTLMWSHYANSHKGFCISYNQKVIRPHFLKNNVDLAYGEVRYSKCQGTPVFLAQHGVPNTKQATDAINQQLLTKNLNWVYEEEFRIIHAPTDSVKLKKDLEEKKKLEYSRQPIELPKNAVYSVIFGHNSCPNFKKDLRNALPKNIKFQQARVCHDRFDHVEILDEVDFA